MVIAVGPTEAVRTGPEGRPLIPAVALVSEEMEAVEARRLLLPAAPGTAALLQAVLATRIPDMAAVLSHAASRLEKPLRSAIEAIPA